MSTPIGIDLGTTFSCVGRFDPKNNVTEIITNECGNNITPSFVSFTEESIIVGDVARNNCANNVKNTIFDVKRLMGKKWSDVKHLKDTLPYTIIEGPSDGVLIEVEYKKEKKVFMPAQISSMILEKMKNIAESYLGSSITDAVITVPAYFNDAERKDTELAGKLAGLNVLRIINEPTAASMAYGLESDSSKMSNILVFDFGGGTLDVTVLTLFNGVYQVKATSGNKNLGGVDIDNAILSWVIQKMKLNLSVWKMTMQEFETRLTDKMRRKILTQCQKAKHMLSGSVMTEIEFDFGDKEFNQKLTRTVFDKLCEEYFKSCIECVDKAMNDSKIPKKDIEYVVLVGGSSRIPKIQQSLVDYFSKDATGDRLKYVKEKLLCQRVDPDVAVAQGAAIQAAKLIGSDSQTIKDMILVDVTPLSLGIESKGGIMVKLIERNSTIPTDVTKTFSTSEDNQPSVCVQIYEGEREITKENNLLGKFDLVGITPAKKGVPKIDVNFKLDANGILTVTAEEVGTKKKNNLTIKNEGKLTEERIKKMLEDAKTFKDDDLKFKKKIIARNDLENYIANQKVFIEHASHSLLVATPGGVELNQSLKPEDIENGNVLLDSATNWLETYFSTGSYDDFISQKDKLFKFFNPLEKNCTK